MAKKREPEESSDTGSEAASEEGRPLPNNPAPQKPPTSDSDSDSESDSDNNTNPKTVAKPIDGRLTPNPKTLAKPMDGRLKAGASQPPVKGSAAGMKRGLETPAFKEAKKPKTKTAAAGLAGASKSVMGEDSSNKLFQRVFSDEDVIALLKGLLDFRATKESDSFANIGEFHEFIQKSVNVTRSQLQDKIRRMKMKYKKIAIKLKNGNDVTFGNQHKKDAYELSEKIWGQNNTERVLETPKVNDSVAGLKESSSGGRASAGVGGISMYSGLEQRILAEKIEGRKQALLDHKWREFEVEEFELYVKRIELMREHAKSVISTKWRDL